MHFFDPGGWEHMHGEKEKNEKERIRFWLVIWEFISIKFIQGIYHRFYPDKLERNRPFG